MLEPLLLGSWKGQKGHNEAKGVSFAAMLCGKNAYDGATREALPLLQAYTLTRRAQQMRRF
jgi:hypothetical protein